MRRLLVALLVLTVAAPAAATAAPARIANVDTGSYPRISVTIVTPAITKAPPKLVENGVPVAGLEAVNLGRAKSVVLAVDRSQSMRGQALEHAAAAARTFVRSKPREDRVAVVAFGSRAAALTGFSTATIDADAALRALDVDRTQGTALHDAVVAAADALASEPYQSRVVIVLTDGRDISSAASLTEAIGAATRVGAAVYPIAIEGPQFSPAPLKRLATATGGRYSGVADASALSAIYSSIAHELRRTWQLSYLTSARPGDHRVLSAAGAEMKIVLPGSRVEAAPGGSRVPDGVLRLGPGAISTLVGLCVLLGAAAVMSAPAGAALRRRLAAHVGRNERKAKSGPVQERFQTASSLMRLTERAFGELRVWRKLHRLLERADLPLRTVELFYIAVGSGLLLGVFLAAAGAAAVLILGAMAVGGLLPIGFVWFKAKRRLTALEDQLPDVLTTIAATLKAGHSFRQGIQSVVAEGQPPISAEFRRVLTETSLGRPMDEALEEMTERLGSDNLSFVITAVTIQRQVGGSLAGIFDMVADAVRNRQQFARKIRSLTAMGRMSAYVLAGIPVFLLIALTLLNREFMDPLYTTSTGHMLLMLGAGMMVMGSLVLRKIVSFRG